MMGRGVRQLVSTDRDSSVSAQTAPIVDLEPARRLRIACVYRNFNGLGSIHSLFKRDAERLTRDADVQAVCMSRKRAETSAPISFVTVDPSFSGSDRVRYAVECASFARRADAAVRALGGSVDVVFSEGFATTEADLVRVHAVRLAETEHYFQQVEPTAMLRWVRTNIAGPQIAVVRGIERRLFAKRPLCVVPTRRLASQLVDWHGVHPDLVTVVPYGLDTTRFSPDPGERARLRDELGVPPDRLVAVLVGSGFARKGVERAVRGLAASGIVDAELWVVGADENLSRFERIARECGVRDRVRFVGARSSSELPGWYAAADVFILPSQQDTAPMTVTEALATGLPAIVSEHAGSSDVVQNGVNGFCIAGSGRPEEIARRLQELADGTVRQRFSARSRMSVMHLDYEVVYPRFYELVRAAAARRRAGV
jgi:glycosyltransferase involved in cell wall biosynthesis